jgi:GDP/UDP-N,N'-diacetylbacillosamine 2-epimerase (hydrolysing)
MKKISYITGSRAEFGLMKQVLKEIKQSKDFELTIVATGMHLMPEFGYTLHEIQKENFNTKIINCKIKTDNKDGNAFYLGQLIIKLTEEFSINKPEIILINGDRVEAIAAALVGNYLMIPVAHVHGGDISSTIDEHIRHATTKLSHIHFAATKLSAERIFNLGEEKWRIHVIGSPGIYGISKEKLMEKNKLEYLYKININKPFLILLQHPVSLEIKNSEKQIENSLEVIKEFKIPTLVIYPNSDAGGRKIIQKIKEYENVPFIKIHKNINHLDFISLLSHAKIILGNSSSAIIEGSFFNLPAINIGSRQQNREKSSNVIDCTYEKKDIKKALKKALSNEFKDNLDKCKNTYFKKNTGKIILEVLKKTEINDFLLQKQLRN